MRIKATQSHIGQQVQSCHITLQLLSMYPRLEVWCIILEEVMLVVREAVSPMCITL
jgi:hypothetical protein